MKVVPFTKREESSRAFNQVIYSVHGFWNDGYLRIYQIRSTTTGVLRSPEITWACGGRDVKQEPDDKVAANCFALAIQDAVKHAKAMEGKDWAERD